MRRMRKTIWGVGFLAAAVLLLLGSFYNVSVGSILIMLLMLVLLIVGILNRNFILMLLSAALFFIRYGQRMGMPEVSPWPILAAAVFGGIGLSVIFPHRRHWKKNRVHAGCVVSGNDGSTQDGKHEGGEKEIVQTNSGEKISLENNFGATVKYLTGEPPEQVSLENNFGSMSVYFDNTTAPNYTVHVSAETSFGSLVLYVPASWKVVVKGDTAFGVIREKGCCNPDGVSVLEIRGEAAFGEIEVRYI